ncbi:MAG: UDP-N-acetylmuramate dehydrogenase [Magnetococcus sp. DMHC-1]|nr:UDP-N-acetylmuramate dehydrogenase [Magnetococcales bacterium]
MTTPDFPVLTRPVAEQVSLTPHTTWRLGGPARWMVFPVTTLEIAQLVQRLAGKVPWLVLGGGSNVLVDDAGFHGVVLNLTAGLNRLHLVDAVTIEAEAGVSTRALAHFARHQGLTGAEFLSGIPGSVGGALRMNAGAYGGDMSKILLSARILTPTGQEQEQTPRELGMSYRHTNLAAGSIFLSGRFRLQSEDPAIIRRTMQDFNHRRIASQPLNHPSAGSVFCNPPRGPAAWRLIEAAGLRGVWQGQAQVAEKHCNFILNRGGARSRDVLTLMETIREKVLHDSGIELKPEVCVLSPDGTSPPW